MNPIQDQHPAAETLLAFSHGRLEEHEFSAVEEHVRDCEQCCAWMANQGDHSLLQLAREVATIGMLQGDTVHEEDHAALPEVLRDHPRYRVIECIGSGGMGAVYKAEHRLMHRMVALKVVHPRWLADAGAIERFQREVRMAAKLSHPNIVASYDADEAAGIHFLVMEFVDGMSLDQRVKSSGPVDVKVACDWIYQALSGLKHSYECGMTHRDIKPANLMITTEGQIKILDFGLSRLSEDSPPIVETNQNVPSGETRADVILGTPDYVAPEQVTSSRAATIQADIYSLGCTLFYLLAGTAPFAGLSTREKLKAQQQRQLPRIEEIRSDVPPALIAILDRMTEKNLEHRFANPSEVMHALQPLLQAPSNVHSPGRGASRTSQGSRRQWLKRFGTASAVTAGAVVFWAAMGFPSVPGLGSNRPVRALVMLPKQGLWFADYQALVTGARNTGTELTFAGLSTEASQTLSASVPGIAVPDVVISRELSARDYDALVFIGYDTSDFSPSGPAGEQSKRLINEFQFEKKVLAALCSGQRVLAQHGALRGKRVSASESVTAEEIEVEGGKQVAETIVVDGRLVTSDATDDASDFLLAIKKILKD
jgi:serine/threonine protein kinase/putative intracellular protease/amidase